MEIRYYLRTITLTLAAIFAGATVALADIGAPKTDVNGTDWGFVVMGAISAFIGALICLWLGRKLFKKS